MQEKWRIMLARFPYGGVERFEIGDWVASVSVWAARQPDIEWFGLWNINDTPITMCRNRAVKEAIDSRADILIMLDSDMVPDIDKNTPFVPLAFEFIKNRWRKAPTIIGVPYLTGGPAYNPTVGMWRTFDKGNDINASLYTREEALAMTGIQPCDLMGTGVMAIDMRIFTGLRIREQDVKLPPPWFDYVYTDEYQTQKASTEDMYFTRKAGLLFAEHGLQVGYCAWDCWAQHVKTQHVGKPFGLGTMDVARLLHENHD